VRGGWPAAAAALIDADIGTISGAADKMKQRFDREAPSQAKKLWSAAYILKGLRYEQALIQTLLRGSARS
jgi:hypothetical protein